MGLFIVLLLYKSHSNDQATAYKLTTAADTCGRYYLFILNY